VDIKTAIRALRDRVKNLASRQRPLKLARKTTLPVLDRALALKRAGMDPAAEFWKVAWEVIERRAQITACLNLMHELKGSEHRHNPGEKWVYDKYDKKLRAEFLAEVKA
jgi:hypothetical protein